MGLVCNLIIFKENQLLDFIKQFQEFHFAFKKKLSSTLLWDWFEKDWDTFLFHGRWNNFFILLGQHYWADFLYINKIFHKNIL